MSIFDSFSDPELSKALIKKLNSTLDGPLRFMEVCGTHTVAIFRSGLHSLLPDKIVHISGPGCPVCVTHESEVAAYLELAGRDDVILATFGDLMRVPGPKGMNLKTAKADGARVEVVYSAFDVLELAQKNPKDKVVFIGIGFETTAPTIAATIKTARKNKVDNFQVLCFHKLVPPALRALLAGNECEVDAFILPGHVSTIIGLEPYKFLGTEFGVPAAITGFEPLDILNSLIFLAEEKRKKTAGVVNLYSRAVSDQGNSKAREIMYEVFEPSDALWRGIGLIPESGLRFRAEYEAFDAMKTLGLCMPETKPLPGCRCGEVLKGKIKPSDCPLFKKACTPATPVGPCMVSTEGSCAAYFKYHMES